MNGKLRDQLGRIASFSLSMAFCAQVAFAQGTTFVYQGKLSDGANPANGSYDFQFTLWDAVSGGTQQPQPSPVTVTRTGVVVSGGIFTVQLDFTVNSFSGADRYLQIAVRPNGGGSFTTLSPRQQISSTPYAIQTINAQQLGGLPASRYVATDANGNVGIGTASPSARLHAVSADPNSTAVYGQSNSRIGVQGVADTGDGVWGQTNTGVGVVGSSSSGLGVIGLSNSGIGVRGVSSTGWAGFFAGKVHISGNVGIGTANPFSSTRVHVVGGEGLNGVVSESVAFTGIDGRSTSGDGVRGTSDSGTGVYGFSTNLFGVFGSSSTGWAGYFNNKVYMLGPVGIGTESPQRTLHVNGRARINDIPFAASSGSVCFNGQGDLLWCGSSSLKLKTNISSFRSGLDVVRRLKPISFDWRDGSGHDIGLGAEDVAKVAPSFTLTDSNGEVAGVKYERLNILLINAVKEQQTQIDSLRAQNASLNARLRSIERRSPSKRGAGLSTRRRANISPRNLF